MQINDKITFNNHVWRVLDIITQRPYHNHFGDVTWHECELRTYLNDTFYNTFSKDERERIIPTVNINADNQWDASNGGVETNDFIFLLSVEEVVCKYFGDSSKNFENRSAKKRYCFQRKDANNEKRKANVAGSICLHSWR